MKIKSFKGHKYQELFEQKALKSLLLPNVKNTVASFKQLDDVDGRPVIRCKFSAFGNIDSDRDMLMKGCFTKSIKEHGAFSTSNRKIAFLWQHDMANPIGKSLLEEELADGAYGNVRMSDFNAVTDAKRAFSQMQDGTINQFSIGFHYIWDKMEYDEDLDAFIVKEVNLIEYSAVTAGANELTSYDGLLNSSDDMKSYLKGLKEYYPQKYSEIKEYINVMDGAKPDKPLTPNWITGYINERY